MMLITQIRGLMDQIEANRRAVEAALIGKTVRVLSDHNGQPYGRSRKSWKGEERRIVSVHLSLQSEDPVLLSLEGHEYGECCIPLSQVQVL